MFMCMYVCRTLTIHCRSTSPSQARLPIYLFMHVLFALQSQPAASILILKTFCRKFSCKLTIQSKCDGNSFLGENVPIQAKFSCQLLVVVVCTPILYDLDMYASFKSEIPSSGLIEIQTTTKLALICSQWTKQGLLAKSCA